MVQRRCTLARAELGAVVDVHAIGDMRETRLDPEFLHLGEQLVFAMETALRVIAQILRPGQLCGVQNVGWNAVLAGELQRGGKLLAGQRGGIRNDRQHPFAQRLVCRPGQKGRIRSAGIRHQQRTQGAQGLIERRGFFL